MRNAESNSPEITAAETLSALADDEAQELELRRVLRDLDGSPELRARWYRLHVARTALSGETVRPSVDFAGSVRAAIDAEPALEQGSSGNWRRTLGSFAVAASVATVVVLGGQQLAATSSNSDRDLVARVAPLPVGVVNTTGAVPVRASFGTRAVPTLEPADRTAYRELARQRLRRYSQEHAEHASLNTPQGMLPFARVPVIEQ
ncbi:sigma-E factor negative regulatory protein [Congregibacter litoralis]|uniref:Anti sigma-E protein, RseA n=1 Tax=Congregibacter litoralis KT71 TaxID=314285 RepID=A4A3V2_9GAMM|nr:sigma-E factor negative regulatory protein [Congregibacter litoralis]EAQ99375.1 anti sigma-E protein, RseA [Congregibacter litoralis KT71]